MMIISARISTLAAFNHIYIQFCTFFHNADKIEEKKKHEREENVEW